MKKDGKRLEDTYQRNTYGRDRKQEEKIKKGRAMGGLMVEIRKNLKEKEREKKSLKRV